MGTLYIVGTPIGNLEDISARALRTLREVSLIASENPQRTRRLLARYDIRTPMRRFTDAYERKKQSRMQTILDILNKDDVALVSEAGMPGLADPGYELIRAALDQDVPVVSIPGPTALSAALSASGVATERFAFLGFLPRRDGARRELLGSLVACPFALVAYEAPHRLLKTLVDLDCLFGNRQVAAACELTKLYEDIRFGTPAELVAYFRRHKPRGEFTLVVAGSQSDDHPPPSGQKQRDGQP